jgi:hypothetical protein
MIAELVFENRKYEQALCSELTTSPSVDPFAYIIFTAYSVFN